VTPVRSLSVGGFIARTLGWLPVSFAVWYFAAPLLVAPAVLLARAVGRIAFGGIVQAVEQAGAIVTFITTLRPGAAVAGGVVTVDVNLLQYSFGLPMLCALTLAARERHASREVVGNVVVNTRGPESGRLLHGRQRLPGDVDQLARVFGGVAALRQHDGDGFADEARAVAGQEAEVLAA